jgi:hypothetical protein
MDENYESKITPEGISSLTDPISSSTQEINQANKHVGDKII